VFYSTLPPSLARATLFVPETAPPEFYEKYYEQGAAGALKLYVRRVFITGGWRACCAHVCMRTRVCVHVRACVRACVRVCAPHGERVGQLLGPHDGWVGYCVRAGRWSPVGVLPSGSCRAGKQGCGWGLLAAGVAAAWSQRPPRQPCSSAPACPHQ